MRQRHIYSTGNLLLTILGMFLSASEIFIGRRAFPIIENIHEILSDLLKEPDNKKSIPDKKKFAVASTTLNRLLKLITSSSEEQENIIGDLLEEFNEFPSRLKAHLWLYKQVLKSVVPLIYKTAKSRLASYFGERVR